jgi:hypothetical protein
VKRHNPADEDASSAITPEVAWGSLYAKRRNGEIDEIAFRRGRRKLFLLMAIPVAASVLWAVLMIR